METNIILFVCEYKFQNAYTIATVYHMKLTIILKIIAFKIYITNIAELITYIEVNVIYFELNTNVFTRRNVIVLEP